MRGSGSGVSPAHVGLESLAGAGQVPLGSLSAFNVTTLCKSLKTPACPLPGLLSSPRGFSGHVAPLGGKAGQDLTPGPRLRSRRAPDLLSCSQRTAQSG